MKLIVLIIALILSQTKIHAQEINPSDYASIPVSMKKRVFSDDFDNNKYFWIKQSSPVSHQIHDGFFFFSNDYDLPYTDGKPINFDANKNFELETKIKFVSGNVESLNGLFWGELIFGDKYFFGFSSMGYYTFNKEIGFQLKEYVKKTKSELINQTADNLFTVRKYNDKYYFFINQELVYEMPYETIPGNYIGFQVASKTMVQINYLKLWTIE